jgi:hypothetical protein
LGDNSVPDNIPGGSIAIPKEKIGYISGLRWCHLGQAISGLDLDENVCANRHSLAVVLNPFAAHIDLREVL